MNKTLPQFSYVVKDNNDKKPVKTVGSVCWDLIVVYLAISISILQNKSVEWCGWQRAK